MAYGKLAWLLCTYTITAYRKNQEDADFKAIFSYIANLCLISKTTFLAHTLPIPGKRKKKTLENEEKRKFFRILKFGCPWKCGFVP